MFALQPPRPESPGPYCARFINCGTSPEDKSSIEEMIERVASLPVPAVFDPSSTGLPHPVIGISDNRRYVVLSDASESLGMGSFKAAYLGLGLSGEKVAVTESRFTQPYPKSRFDREVAMFEALKGPHVVKLIGSFATDRFGYMVFNFCNRLDLFEDIKHRVRSAEEIVSLIRQAIEAILHVHQLGYAHGDIRLENFLLHREKDGPLELFLADPDYAVKSSDTNDRVPTTANLAPEQVRLGQGVSLAADMWSLGCVLYELIMRENPPWSKDAMAITFALMRSWDCAEVARVHLRQRARRDVPVQVIELIEALLCNNPAHRLTAQQAYERISAL